jgi:4-amino-4-deoxy-L-arabinose transferase-like glycosyltransferase
METRRNGEAEKFYAITHYDLRFTHHESRSTKEVLPLLSLRRRIESLTPKQIVLLVFVIAFLIRLAFLATKPHAFTHQLQAGDEPVYHGIAANLAEGQGYVYDGQPTARYGPGYPVFIAAIYRTFGVNPVFGRFGNVVLGALLCVLIALWSLKIWGANAGIVSGLFAAFYYSFVQLPPYLMTENLYLPLFVAAMMGSWWLSNSGETSKRFGSYAVSLFVGTLWGVTALTRAIALPISLLASLWLAVRGQLKLAGILVATIILVLLPWTVRNWLVFKTFAPIQLSAGHDLYLSFGPSGTEPKVLGHWNWGSDVERPKLPEGLTPAEQDKWLRQQALACLKSNPMEALVKRAPRKLANLLVPFYGTASLPNKLLTSLFYLTLLLLSVPSLIKAWKSKDHKERTFAELVLLVALFTITFHAIFYGVVRYRYPIDALLLVFVGRWWKVVVNRQ